METEPGIPELRIVETRALRPHERADVSRASALARRISQDGCLRNPILALPLEDGGEWLVLDGANRSEALRSLGLPHVLVQVVRSKNEGLRLGTWNRVVFDCAPNILLEALKAMTMMRRRGPNEEEVEETILVVFPDGSQWGVGEAQASLEQRLVLLHRILEAGESIGRMERTEARSVAAIEAIFPGLAGLLRFRPFKIEEVMEAGKRALLFPAGITRFIASPRALRVNFPLEQLSAGLPTEQKQSDLEAWLAAKVRTRQVRYYPESTYIFDE